MASNLKHYISLLQQPKTVHVFQILMALWILASYLMAPFQRPDSFEFGGYLLAGYRLNAGQTLYKDWHFMYGPLVAYWASVVVKTGWSLPALHRLYFLPEAIGTSLAIYTTLRVARPNLLFSFLVLLGSLSFFAVGARWCGVLVALVLFSNSLVEGRKVLGYLAGLAVGIQVLYFQDIAVYTGITLFVLFCILLATRRFNHKDQLTLGFSVLAGFLTVALILSVFLSMIGALPNYVDRAWVFTAKYYDKFAFADPPRFFSIVEAQSSNRYDKFVLPLVVRWISGTFSFYILPTVGAIGVVFYTSKIKRTSVVTADLVVKLALSIISIILFRIVFKTGDTIKLAVNLFPAVILSFTLVRDTAKTRLQFVPIILVVCVLSMTLYPYVRNTIKARDGITKIESNVEAKERSDRETVVAYLRTRISSTNKFVALPNDTLLYIDLNQINPLSFDYFDPIVSPRYDKTLADELETRAPKYIVWDRSARFWSQWEMGNNFGLLTTRRVHSTYLLEKTFGTYEIYVHKHYDRN